MKKLLLPFCLLFILSCENEYIEVKNPFKKDEIIELFLKCTEKPSYTDPSSYLWERNFAITINKTTNDGTLNDFWHGEYNLIETDEGFYIFKHTTKQDFMIRESLYSYEYKLNRITLDITEENNSTRWECKETQRI